MVGLSPQKQLSLEFESDLADAILAYLVERPQAMDSLEGIAEWWLMRQQIRSVVQRVEGVLQHLIARGVLEAVQVAGVTRYRLRRTKPEETVQQD